MAKGAYQNIKEPIFIINTSDAYYCSFSFELIPSDILYILNLWCIHNTYLVHITCLVSANIANSDFTKYTHEFHPLDR